MLLTVSPMTCPDTRPTSYGCCFSEMIVRPLVLCRFAIFDSRQPETARALNPRYPNEVELGTKEARVLRCNREEAPLLLSC